MRWPSHFLWWNFHRKVGMRCIWEQMRWNMWVEQGDEEFKMCDNYIAHYARLLMEIEPELRGFFDTKRLRTP